jgi:hypothetical protein
VSDDLREALRRLPDEWEHTGHLRSAGTDMGARANNEQVDREVEALREWVDAALAAAEPVRDPEPKAALREVARRIRAAIAEPDIRPDALRKIGLRDALHIVMDVLLTDPSAAAPPASGIDALLSDVLADAMDPSDYGCSPPSAAEVVKVLAAKGYAIARLTSDRAGRDEGQ